MVTAHRSGKEPDADDAEDGEGDEHEQADVGDVLQGLALHEHLHLVAQALDRADEVTRPIPERKGPPPQRSGGRHPRNVRVIPRSRDFH